MAFIRHPISITLTPIVLVVTVFLLCQQVFSHPICGAAVIADDSPEAIQLDDTAGNLYRKADASGNPDDFKLAAELWQQLLTEHPTYSRRRDVQFFLGLSYYRLKQFDKAAEQLDQLKQSLDDFDDYRRSERLLFYLAFCQYSLGKSQEKQGQANLENAVANYETFFREFPQSQLTDQALFFKGEAHYRLFENGDVDHFKLASDAYQRILDDYPKSTFRQNALYSLAVGYQDAAEHEQASQLLASYLEQFPDSDQITEVKLRRADSLLSLATAQADTSDGATAQFAAAGQLYSEVINDKQFGQRDHALFNQAICLMNQGQIEPAAENYARLATEYPQSEFAQDATLAAGKYFFAAKQYDQASQWLTRAYADNSQGTAEAAHWLCRIDIQNQQYDAAIQRATAALEVARDDPFRVHLYMDTADALYEQPENRAKSIGFYRTVADEFPDDKLAPKALYYAAFASLETGDNATAIKLAKQFADEYASDSFAADTRQVLGEALLKEQKYSDAQNVFEQLIGQHSEHASRDWWYSRAGWAMYLQQDYQTAINRLANVATDMTDSRSQSEALYVVGASHFQLENFDEAVEAFKSCLESNADRPNADEVQLLIARSQFELGDTGQAMESAKALLKNDPSPEIDTQTKYWLGEFAFLSNQFLEAVNYYNAAIENGPSPLQPDCHYGKAWSLLKMGEHETAAAEFDALIGDFPQHARIQDALIGRGMARRLAGNYQDAIDDFDKFLEGQPGDQHRFSAMYERGLAYVGLKQWDRAIESLAPLSSDATQNPDLADDVLYELAWAHKNRSDDEQAVNYFRKIADQFNDSPFAAEANYHVAQQLYDDEEFEQAIQYYLDCLNSAKDDSIAERAAYKLGWSYFRGKQYEKAHSAFVDQTKRFPEGRFAADGLFMVSESLFRDNKHQQAITAYKVAVPAVNSSSEVKENVKMLAPIHGAQSANKTKDFQTAIEFIEPLLEQHPDSDFAAEAYFELGTARKGLGQNDQAVAAWSEAVKRSLGKTGARAKCMIAEEAFDQKKYDEAIRQFKLVIYGYGGENSADDIKPWQAFAAYEAARCYYVQIRGETDRQRRNQLVSQSQELFGYVVKNFPNNQLAEDAKRQLTVLENIK